MHRKSRFVSVLVLLAGVRSANAAEPNSAASIDGFVDLEWRVMTLGGHVSHGPGFAAGISLLEGQLRVGIAGLNRPGPWNPATFDVELAGDTTYRGKRSLSLRSDGAMAGPQLALAFAVPKVPWLAVTLPFTVGYGGFGFYLHGDDRVTPDGRRVSVWENELFDGRDSFLGWVLDGGVRLNFVPARTPWLRPYVGVYYTAVPGFDTIVRGSYSGFSGALGLELGTGS